ncbi:MAG: hypothetical protein ACFE91_00765 [Promethearchaeota archaeon]
MVENAIRTFKLNLDGTFDEIAQSIKKDNLVEEYSKVLLNLKKALIFEELKDEIKKLNTEGLNLLKEGKLLPSLEKFKKFRNL